MSYLCAMPGTITTQIINTQFGDLLLGENESKLVLCDWKDRTQRTAIDQRVCKGLDSVMQMGQSPFLDQVESQLRSYLLGESKSFDLNTKLVGTPFQKRVWEALHDIPYGKTISYHQLSNKLGDTKAIRAVASANGANALSLVIPCHRVIGANGQLTGYAGGLEAKKGLLQLEGAIDNSQQSLFD